MYYCCYNWIQKQQQKKKDANEEADDEKKEVIKEIEKCIEAMQNVSKKFVAAFKTGFSKFYGIGETVVQDKQKGYELIKQAAQKFSEASFCLSVMRKNNEIQEISIDKEAIVNSIETALYQCGSEEIVQFLSGIENNMCANRILHFCNEHGKGTSKNLEKAQEYTRRAVKLEQEEIQKQKKIKSAIVVASPAASPASPASPMKQEKQVSRKNSSSYLLDWKWFQNLFRSSQQKEINEIPSDLEIDENPDYSSFEQLQEHANSPLSPQQKTPVTPNSSLSFENILQQEKQNLSETMYKKLKRCHDECMNEMKFIDYEFVNEKETAAIAKLLVQLPRVKTLEVIRTTLGGNISYILGALKDMKNCTQFWWCDNELGKNGAKLDQLQFCTQLTNFWFCEKFQFDAAATVPSLVKSLTGLVNLQYLDLSYNSFAQANDQILDAIVNCGSSLQVLYVANTGLDHCKKFSSLAFLKNLRYLDCSSNALTANQTLKDLSMALKDLGNLRELDLSNNSLGSAGVEILLEVFETMSNLREVKLSNNGDLSASVTRKLKELKHVNFVL